MKKYKVKIMVAIISAMAVVLAALITACGSNSVDVNIKGDTNNNNNNIDANANADVSILMDKINELESKLEEQNNSSPNAGGGFDNYDVYTSLSATTPVSFVRKIPPYEVSHSTSTSMDGASNGVKVRDFVDMGGIKYEDVITYTSGALYKDALASFHNLEGEYIALYGCIGRVDKTQPRDATFNFYGDGSLLQSFDLKSNDMPTEITVNVTDVKQLKIEVVNNGKPEGASSWQGATYAFVGTIE